MGRLKVYLRLKAVSSGETDISELENDTTVIIDPRIGNQKASTLTRKAIRYTFKKIFDTKCTQQDVFRRVALPSVRDVLSGKPSLIFINGAAGSGKTNTIIGTPEDAGILPRTLDVLFNSIPPNLQAMKFVFKPDELNGYEARLTEDAMIDRQNVLLSGSRIAVEGTPKGQKGVDDTKREKAKRNSSAWSRRDRWNWEHTKVASDIPDDYRVAIFVQFVEIYNNCVFDLLNEKAPNAQDTNRGQPWKNIRHDASKCTYVYGATEVEVENADEAMEVFVRGQARKHGGNTKPGSPGSCGSHSVYTIKLVQAPINEKTGELIQEKDFITVTQFSLVDLAGGEGPSADSSSVYSSMCLRSCLNTLRENQEKRSDTKVPYRDSRLTHLFKSFFEGIGSIKMILCVNPRLEDYAKTIDVMKFAETVEEIEIERENTKRKLTFVDLSPAPSVEDLYTTAYDAGSILKQAQVEEEEEEEPLDLNRLHIEDEEHDPTMEDRDTVSFSSSAEVPQEELQNALSRAAYNELKYRRKSKLLEETLAKLNQVQREKAYFKQRLGEVQAQKESIESRLLSAEESLLSLRHASEEKYDIQKEVEDIGSKKKKKRSSKENRSSGGHFSSSVTESTETNSSSNRENHIGSMVGAEDTSSDRAPERPRRRKQRCSLKKFSVAGHAKFETNHPRFIEETIEAIVSSRSKSVSPQTKISDGSTDDWILPRESSALVKEEVSDEESKPGHVSVMETKERCKIAIEGHPLTRNLVYRTRRKSSFKIKDFFASSRK